MPPPPPSRQGMTPLHQAAKHGRADAVRALIAAGALVECKDVSTVTWT